jgi:hypothetical protein
VTKSGAVAHSTLPTLALWPKVHKDSNLALWLNLAKQISRRSFHSGKTKFGALANRAKASLGFGPQQLNKSGVMAHSAAPNSLL